MKTRADQILERIKNNKLVAVIIVAAVIVIGVANFKDALQKLGLSVFGQKKERKELAGDILALCGGRNPLQHGQELFATLD